MKQYVGTKIIAATAMTRGDYNAYRGWTIPENENPADPGYLVEYLDGGLPNDERHAGYISWSPLDAFDGAYRASGQMSFGHALEMLKRGHPVQRAGWNGSGMFVYHVPGNRYAPSTFVGRGIADGQPDGLVPYLPYLALKTVSGAIATWVPSSTDVLADDWSIVGES